MNKSKAKLKFYPNRFDIVEDGDHVVCAVSGKQIPLNELSYWNVQLQEAYFSPKEAKIRFSEGLILDPQDLAPIYLSGEEHWSKR